MKQIALIICRNGVWKAFDSELKKRNVQVTLLDPFKSKDLNLLLNGSWDGVIWTAKHTPKIKNLAKRIINLYDKDPKTNVFPSWNCYWHYDDKISQYFLFTKEIIPIPKTYLFYNKEEALKELNELKYPLIFKATDGAGSSNVQIVPSFNIAKKLTKKLFGRGVKTFFKNKRQKGYLLCQKFERNNPGDFRLVCYGNEILGHFRPNRKDVPLASGSDIYLYQEIPNDLLDLIYNITQKLNSEVMSYDVIKNENNEWVIGEMSVIYGNYGYAHYENSKVYRLTENKKWEIVENPGGHYERVANYILNSWNLDD